MILRDYQDDAIAKLRLSLAAGHKRPVIQAPTGSGKTVIAAAIVKMARAKGNRVIFCVPAIELIDQTVERFQRNGITEVGVIQANHELTDYSQPVQVCSVQTLSRRDIPMADLVIIDEAHVRFKLYERWVYLPQWSKVPFVGLTATPWSKGMGKIFDDLIVGVTMQDLIDQGHLSDFKVYAPAHPDLSGVRTVLGDYDLKGLGKAMDKSPLVADIVSTWFERAKDLPTLCFAVNRVHAKHIQKQFEEAGVATGYVDAYTDRDERRDIAAKFASGEIKIVCNVGVLTTGVDWDVRCLILARPTKSEILYCQIIGRALRPAPGKDHALILDHSDTTLRLGFVTDIAHDTLDDGKANHVNPQKKILLPKECPKCSYLKPPKTRQCPACGFVPEPMNSVETETGELMELTKDRKQKKNQYTMTEKLDFYSELLCYCRSKGYKDGWAYWAYKDKFGVAPAIKSMAALSISPKTASWIKSRNIAKAKAREKAGAA
jgi:superfamily II DNA or RNA helicase